MGPCYLPQNYAILPYRKFIDLVAYGGSMKVVKSILELREALGAYRKASKKLALVPTMGALHEGHLSLFRLARREADVVAASVFVNPTQFNSKEDLEKYPRTLEADLKALDGVETDLVFAPEQSEIFPTNIEQSTRVLAGEASLGLCGAARPGHFNGVVQIVAILFNLFRPDIAVFGEKDYQQLKVLESLNHDLHFGIRILRAPLVREKDGLALSSRNSRLSAEDRKYALKISESLFKASKLFKSGEKRVEKLKELINSNLSESGHLIIDYVEIVDTETLEPLASINSSAQLCVAVFCGSVRLIDNIRLES